MNKIYKTIINTNIPQHVDRRMKRLGTELVKENKVTLGIEHEQRIQLLVVDGSDLCRVNVSLKRYGVDFMCTCRRGQHSICKHRIAALLFLQDKAGKMPQEPQWKQTLDEFVETVGVKPSKSNYVRHFVLFFGLSQDYYHDYKITPYRIWANKFPDDIYSSKNRELLVSSAQLAQLVATRPDLQALAESYRSTKYVRHCLNASPEVVHLCNGVDGGRSYSYYDITLGIELLPALVSFGVSLFRSTSEANLAHLLQANLQGKGLLAVNPDEGGIRLGIEIQPEGDAPRVIHTSDEPDFFSDGESTWFLSNQSLIQVEDDSLPLISEGIWDDDDFVIPYDQKDFFAQNYLLQMTAHVELGGDGIVWLEPPSETVKSAGLYLEEKNDALLVRLQFHYGEAILPYVKNPPSVSVESIETGDNDAELDAKLIYLSRVERDVTWEEDVYRSVSSAQFGLKRDTSQDTAGYFTLRAKVDLVDFLLKKMPNLIAAGFEIYGEEKLTKARVNRQKPTISFNVSSGIDWFDLETLIQFGDVPVGLKQFRQAVRNKQQYVKLSDGTMGEIPADWLSKYQHLFKFGREEEDGTLRLDSHHIALLDQLLAEADNAVTDDGLQRRLDSLRSFETIQAHHVPDQFHGELRDYQKAGFDWLYFLREFKFGGCLADDMGLGKTVQVLAFLSSLYTADHSYPPSLVVMPRSILANWEREAEKFAPHLKTCIHFGNDRATETADFTQYNLIFTTYGIALRDVHLLREFRFHYVILDESQAIKNPNTKTAKGIRLLQSDYRLALTGTPVENSTYELWSQFAFLNPGLLGNIDYFKKEFGNPIQRGGEEGQASAEFLRKMVYPFILRRSKKQVATDLPPRTDRVLYVDMEPSQKKFYEKTRDRYRAELLSTMQEKGLHGARMKILEGLLRLRQISNHAKLVKKSFRGESGKMNLLIETMENLAAEGHKALIFSQFVQMLSLIRAELDSRGIKYNYLDGQTRKRQEQVDQFQDDPAQTFFLISLKAGGVGLNLTAADYVIHVDPWWNPAVEMQATDRSHRIGQDKPVFVYKMITRGTVEEKILQLQEQKRKLVEQLITTEGSFFKDLSADDVDTLFS